MTDNNGDEFYDDALDDSFELEDEDYDEVDFCLLYTSDAADE